MAIDDDIAFFERVPTLSVLGKQALRVLAIGAETRQLLVDFGFTGDTLNNNLDLLGIDAAKLDAMLLSHGHYDHFGGMVGFLAAHQERLRPGLPFYLGGEECFCSRETGPADAPSNFGALSRRAIAQAGLREQEELTFAGASWRDILGSVEIPADRDGDLRADDDGDELTSFRI